jgi:hypothetical protein
MDGAKNCGTYAVTSPSEGERLRTQSKRARNIRNQAGSGRRSPSAGYGAFPPFAGHRLLINPFAPGRAAT